MPYSPGMSYGANPDDLAEVRHSGSRAWTPQKIGLYIVAWGAGWGLSAILGGGWYGFIVGSVFATGTWLAIRER